MEAKDQKQMHVLVIAPTPFFSDRGCHVRILEEIRAIEPHGYRSTVVTYHLGKDVEGLPIARSARVPWYNKLSAGPSVHKFYLDALLFWTAFRTAWRDRPDVIHAHLHEGVGVGWAVGLLLGVPVVGDLHGSLVGGLAQHAFIKPGGLLYRFFRGCERWLVRRPAHLVFSSSRATEGALTLEELRQPYTIVIDGVDVNVFSQPADRQALRTKLGLPTDGPLVGYLGVLNEYQGVSVMLHAAQRVLEQRPDTTFLVMGYPDVERYQAEAERLGIAESVRFPGRIPYAEAPDYLAACDIGVSAKQDVTEANGKLLNYMAVGLPTVATDTPVNREILGDEAALFGQVDDPASLSDGLLTLLNDQALADRLGDNARRRAVDVLSWEAGGQRLAEVYQSLMPRTSPQPVSMG